jgi:hypothetical protein
MSDTSTTRHDREPLRTLSSRVVHDLDQHYPDPRRSYASRPNGQLTAEVSHLLDLRPCWLLLGLAPTRKRRLLTAHTQGRRFGIRFEGIHERPLLC